MTSKPVVPRCVGTEPGNMFSDAKGRWRPNACTEMLVSRNKGAANFSCTVCVFFFQAEDGIRDYKVTGVQTCALPILGTGPFFGETLREKMVALQVFNVSVALTSFLLACFVEARERQEEMSRLYASAQLGNEEKTRFLHMAAHELRTPITVVMGYLSMLSDGTFGVVPDAWRKPFETLNGKTRELNTIVADLLEASRIEAKAMPRDHDQLDQIGRSHV